MNKKDLIDAVADKTGSSKVDAAAAVDAVFEAISGALVAREKVADRRLRQLRGTAGGCADGPQPPDGRAGTGGRASRTEVQAGIGIEGFRPLVGRLRIH